MIIQTTRPTPAIMTASFRRMTGQSVTIWPLDQSQRSLSDGDDVPLTYPASCSTVALVLVLLEDGDILLR